MTYAADPTHLAGFVDFVALEGLAGGPSANIKVLAEAGKLLTDDPVDRLWLACCYAAIYNSPSALAIWSNVSRETAEMAVPRVTAWLTDNWEGLPVHSNRRRTCGVPRKLAESLQELAAWAYHGVQSVGPDYDALWREVNSIRSVGRYFGIKLAEALYRLDLTEATAYDVRVKGAKNGRRTLACIYPEIASVVGNHHDCSKPAVSLTDDAAAQLRFTLADRYGLKPTWFEFEALLCEYEQCCKGKRYPGKTSDADLAALGKVERHFGKQPFIKALYQARAATHPVYSLGELMGWNGIREDLLPLYRDRGYMWSDGLDAWAGEDTSLILPTPREPYHIGYARQRRPGGN